MAWIKVEASVRTHEKFLAAGPAACWLWLCGLAYCQEGLTDGFIPFAALTHLGVKAPNALKAKLVTVGLWHEVAAGWQVHGYLTHNKPAAEVRRIQDERRAGGFKGGRPTETLKVNLADNPSQLSSATNQTGSDAAHLISSPEPPRMDSWARELVELYPAQARCGWNLVERPLFDVLAADGLPAPAAWRGLVARLEAQKRSYQWRVKRMIPRLDKWLREGMHLQELPEHVADELAPKTNRTLQAAAEILRGDL